MVIFLVGYPIQVKKYYFWGDYSILISTHTFSEWHTTTIKLDVKYNSFTQIQNLKCLYVDFWNSGRHMQKPEPHALICVNFTLYSLFKLLATILPFLYIHFSLQRRPFLAMEGVVHSFLSPTRILVSPKIPTRRLTANYPGHLQKAILSPHHISSSSSTSVLNFCITPSIPARFPSLCKCIWINFQ